MPEQIQRDRLIVHGVLMAVFGRGVLITGPSGVGKSHLALALLDRGHKLVADDAVQIELADGAMVGSAPAVTRGILAVRGIGMVDVAAVIGSAALQSKIKIEYCVECSPHAEEWGADHLSPEFPAISLLREDIPVLQVNMSRPHSYPVLIETWLRTRSISALGVANAVAFRHDRALMETEKKPGLKIVRNAVKNQ